MPGNIFENVIKRIVKILNKCCKVEALASLSDTNTQF